MSAQPAQPAAQPAAQLAAPKPIGEAVRDALDRVANATTPPEFVEVEVVPRHEGGLVTGDTLVREIRIQTGALPTQDRKRFSGLDVRALDVELKGWAPDCARYVVRGIARVSLTAVLTQVQAVVAAWRGRLGDCAP